MVVGMVNDTSGPKTLPPGGVGDDQVVEAEAVERPENGEGVTERRRQASGLR